MKTKKNKILFIAFGMFFTLCTLFFVPPSEAAEDSICARVKIEIRQEVTLERQAFDAHMRINNGLNNITLENVGIEVNFTDEDGNSVLASSNPDYIGAKFFIRVDSTQNINDVNGTGTVQPSSSADIHWLIIPAPGASNGLKQGTLYYVGATLRYSIGGEEKITEVSPDYIYVKPMPELTLDYFLPNDVYGDDAFTAEIEPIVPFNLGVRVMNNGGGVAKELKIESAQPRIVENEQGLLINFLIEGSEVNGEPATPSLLADFGDIDSNTSGVARWIMTTTLSGKFVEFSADYSHSDELGGELTSVFQSINTHFLVHDVLVDLPGRDTIKDFLSEELRDYTVYESNSVDTGVLDASASSTMQMAGMTGTLTTMSTAEFIYVKLDDPFSGENVIKEVIRSDGKRIKPENVWLSKTRNKSDPWQYFFNLFDVNSTGSYTVVFETPPPPPPQPPVLQFIPNRTRAEGEQLSFVVEASDPNGTIPVLTASSLPAGARFSDQGDIGNGIATGYFDWKPQPGQGGRYKVMFTASDGELTDFQSAILTVCPRDTDCDGYTNANEIAAGSDPDDPNSTAELTKLVLRAGYNQLTFPAVTSQYGNLQDFIEDLGGSTFISQVLLYYPDLDVFKYVGYDQAGTLIGQKLELIPAEGISGLIIYAKQDATLDLSSKYCPPWDLLKGSNLVGSPCITPDLTAFQLLQYIGESMVISIQRFNPETGGFETANYQNHYPAGVDFLINPEDAYFIKMKQDVLGLMP